MSAKAKTSESVVAEFPSPAEQCLESPLDLNELLVKRPALCVSCNGCHRTRGHNCIFNMNHQQKENGDGRENHKGDTCMIVDGIRQRVLDKTVPTAMILTMNVPAEALDQWQYPTLLGINAKLMEGIFGHSEELYACNTYQFSDYSRYAINYFKEEDKRAYRNAHFSTDLANARALGKRLAEKAAANG